MVQTQFLIIEKDKLEELLIKVNRLYSLFNQPEGITSNTQKVYSNKEASVYLKVCPKTLQNYRDAGIIEFIQNGRKICYTQTNLNNYLEKYKKELFKKRIQKL